MTIFWGLAILLTSIISIPMGGMLTPEFLQTNLEYYGLMSPLGNSSGLEVYPGYPYHFGNPNEWALGQLSLLKELQMYIQQGLSGYSYSIWVLEQIIFNSVRVLFFPILGIIAFYFLPKKLENSAKQEDTELPTFKNFFVLIRFWNIESRIFKEISPDIIHSYNYAADYTEPLAARMAGIKWIYTKKNMSWKGPSYRGWRLRTFLANGIIAQNSDMIRDFFYNNKKAKLIPMGIDIDEYKKEQINSRVLKKWNIDNLKKKMN